jgi:hypothetical protein
MVEDLLSHQRPDLTVRRAVAVASQPQWWRRVDLAFVQSGWHEPR